MRDYDKIAEQIKKNTTVKEKKASIFEPHFELIVELSKRGIRKTDILDYIKSIDPLIASKNVRTVQSLFSQYINRQRIQKLISTNIFISEAVITSTIKEKKKKREKKEKKEDITPVAKQEGEEVVEKTTIDSLSDEGEKKQTGDDNFFANKLLQIQAAKNKKEN